MPKTRTTHVRRIKNADNENVWIDVERVDKIVNKQEGQGGLYRKTTRQMFWGDETDDAAHPTREMTELRVEKPSYQGTFVLINVIDKQKTRRGQGPDYKKKYKWFSNLKENNTAREVSFRRVYHWDTETDPNDDGGTEYVRVEGTEDRAQYLDVAVIEKLIQRRGQGPSYKKRTYQFNTDPIKEFSEPSPEDVDPATVVWLDPWQNIINVKWDNPPDPYIILVFDVFRRFTQTLGGEIIETLIQYQNQGLWPVDGNGDPVTEVPPDIDWEGAFGISGVPDLPQVSNFGAGLPSGGGGNPSEEHPGARFAPTSGGPSGIYPGVPDPPPFGDIGTDESGWGSTNATYELYEVLLESGGDTQASFDIDFSNVTTTQGEWIYTAINGAAFIKEEGFVTHNPPFTGPPAGSNGTLDQARFWVLLQISNPPPGYDP